MLLYVPQGYVALVYEDGALRAVVEAGVGYVAQTGRLQVQYVDLLQQQRQDQEAEVPGTMH